MVLRMLVLALAVAYTSCTIVTNATVHVLVTGATGRTGSLLYKQLKADSRVSSVRALVRNATKAKAILGCTKCDASEGIYIGDVTKPATLTHAMAGVDTVAIAAGVGGGASASQTKAVEYTGVENQAAALAMQNVSLASLRVVLCSSMGTETPPTASSGSVFFWKLNAEAFLFGSGIASTVVKPCGLQDGPSGQHTLGTSHNDVLPDPHLFMINRADVAAVMKEAIIQRTASLRFDLCSLPGSQATDPAEVLKSATWPWQKRAPAA